MAKRLQPRDEVSIEEIKETVLTVIVERFGHRVLTIDTARSALAHAAFDPIQAHLKDVAGAAR
jgi:hypothetical protein